MPNWCNNELFISVDFPPGNLLPHELESLENGRAWKQLQEVNKCLEEDTKKSDKDKRILGFQNFVHSEQNENWYENNVSNWGTKWNITCWNAVLLEERHDREISAFFDTAWSPPLNFVKNMSKQYPDLVIGIQYAEWGMDFGGFAVFKKGKMVEDKDWSIYDILTSSEKYVDDDTDNHWELYDEIKDDVTNYM
mgnify:FL=1